MRRSAITICLFGGLLAYQANIAGAHPHSPLGDRSASNRDHFVQLGEAVHGGFGPLIALGIRIGDDAMQTLGAGPRQLDVTYYTGPQAPCPCVVDGVMLVTAASPGQNALRVSAEPAGVAEHGRVVFRRRADSRRLEYVIPLGVAALVAEGLKGGPERRWSVMMDAPAVELFTKRFLD